MSLQLDIFTTLKTPPTVTSDRVEIDARRVGAVYHNTTAKRGPELEAAEVKASKQTEVILGIFRDHPYTSFTPWDVYNHLGQQMMITSVRRAITTLTDAGHLQRTEERRRSGPAGETNYTWRLLNQIEKEK